MIISKDQRKHLTKSSTIMMKTFNKLEIEENFLNLIKNIYKKPIVNILSEKFKALLLILGTKQGCPLSPTFLNIILEVLANSVRQDKKRLYIFTYMK